MEVWAKLNLRYRFSPGQQSMAERALALRLIRNDSPQTLSYLDQIEPNPDDLGLQEGRIRAALSHRDWGRALTWTEALPADLRESEGWRYWRARALEKMGHDAQAGALFRMVARERSYYGFLAADRLGADYHLENIPLEIGDFDLASVAALPGLQRARELHFFGRLVLARLEWDKATRKLNQEKLQVAAKLAQGWGWHDRAIFTLARTGYWDDLELRFPLEYQGQIETTAHSYGLDSAWIFAVMRQESAFITDARSSAGALGLMQLMPGTARLVARRLKRRLPRTADLLEPETNIGLRRMVVPRARSRLPSGSRGYQASRL